MIQKFWLVVTHEYLRHVKRKRFVFALLSIPLLVLLLIGVAILSARMQYDGKPAGVVDLSGAFPVLQSIPKDLQNPSLLPAIGFIPYDSEQDARAALDARMIQAYFVIDIDYLQNAEVSMVFAGKIGNTVESDFRNYIRYNLFSDLPVEIRSRLGEGSNLIIRSPDGRRELAENNIMGIILPILAGAIFVIGINTTGGYLLEAMVEEKENRTMEIMMTSLSPHTLMTAKIISSLTIGLTQLVFWLLFGWASILCTRNLIPFLTNFSVAPSFFILLIMTFLPAFVMVGALMAMVGALATESSEAQQVAGLFSLPIIIPYWFITTIMFNPNGPVAIGLSMFPFSATVALPLRVAFTEVPGWQIAVALGILLFCSIGALWLASRAFQRGMLRYGKKLAIRDLFRHNA
jgi:ABC-2 type transport system permease protein